MRTRAVVLKKQNTNEYDQLVTCYTEEFGKLTAVAKSALKPISIQSMHLDVFNLAEFDLISGKGTPIITGAQVENSFLNLKSSLPSLAVGYFFTEVIDRIAFEYQKDERLWEFVLSLFNSLDRQNVSENYFREKQLEFLDILGYAPNFDECIFCGTTQTIAFNQQARGAVCKDCFLSEGGGIVVHPTSSVRKDRTKINDWLPVQVLGGILESLVEKKLYSLNLIKDMVI